VTGTSMAWPNTVGPTIRVRFSRSPVLALPVLVLALAVRSRNRLPAVSLILPLLSVFEVARAEYDLAFAAYHLIYARDRAQQPRYVFGAPRCRFLER
jgi:hypothetical protein